MSEIAKEMKENLDTFFENATKAQKRLEEKQGKTDERIEKLTDIATKAFEAYQNLETKQKAQEEAQKELEKKLYEMPRSSSDNKEDKKIKNEMIDYFKTGRPVSQESIEKIANQIVEKSFYGSIDETDKAHLKKSLVVGVDPQVGYFVRPELSNRILTRLFETSPMRDICTIENTASGEIQYIIDDEEFAEQGWVGEVETRTETNESEVGIVKIFIHEHAAQPLASQTMLDDAGFDIEGWITRKISRKFSRFENTSFVTGNDSKSPRGFLTYPAWSSEGVYERGKIEQRVSSVSQGFNATDLINLQTDLTEFYQPNARWIMTRKTFGEVMKLTQGTGDFLMNLVSMMSKGAEKVILGAPVTLASDMPQKGSNSLSIAYGDFKEGYTIVDRFGIRTIRDIYTKKPFIKFYTTKRVGGAVTNFEAIKILKCKA